MEIRSIETVPLAYPLGPGNAFGDARGFTDTHTAALIKLVAGDGTIGWGEAFAPPRTTTALVGEVFADTVVGASPWDAGSLAEDVYTGRIGSYHLGRGPAVQAALTGIEVAMWDLRGKAVGKPVRDLLGGRSRDEVTPYASTMYIIEDDREIARPIEAAVEEGLTAAKIKIGRDVEDDVRRVATAREVLGDDAHLMVDYNGNYTANGAIESIRNIEEYDLTWVEEPVPPENPEGYEQIRERVDVPLAAGEAHFGRFEFTDLVTDGLVDIVQPNLCRCGGFAEARYIAQVATTANVRVRPHVWNSGVGVAAALQFAATVPSYPERADRATEPILFEFDRSDNPLRDEILGSRFDPAGGSLSVPDGPGLGIDIDDDALARYRLD